MRMLPEAGRNADNTAGSGVLQRSNLVARMHNPMIEKILEEFDTFQKRMSERHLVSLILK